MTVNNTFLVNEQAARAATINYVAFFTDYDAPAAADLIATKNEIGRVAVTPTIDDLNNITGTYSLTTGQCNCLSTTVASSTSTTSFTLNSTVGLAVYDRISIAMGTGTVQRKVMTLPGGNVVTINAALTSAPGAGIVVQQMISQKALIQNGTGSANSGVIIDCVQWKKYKDSTMSISNMPWKVIEK